MSKASVSKASVDNPVAKNAQKFSKGSGRHGGPPKYSRKEKHKGGQKSLLSFIYRVLRLV